MNILNIFWFLNTQIFENLFDNPFSMSIFQVLQDEKKQLELTSNLSDQSNIFKWKKKFEEMNLWMLACLQDQLNSTITSNLVSDHFNNVISIFKMLMMLQNVFHQQISCWHNFEKNFLIRRMCSSQWFLEFFFPNTFC